MKHLRTAPLRASILLALPLALAGCGGGWLGPHDSGASSNPSGQTDGAADVAQAAAYATKDYIFPYQVGDRVVHTMNYLSTPIRDAEPSEVTQALTIGGKRGFELKQLDSRHFISVDDSGVTDSLLPYDSNDDAGVQLTPFHKLPALLHVGDTFTSYDQEQSGQDTAPNGSGTVPTITRDRVTETVEGLEDVTTPAGTFAQCLRIRANRVMTKQSGASAPVVISQYVSYRWYAPGVGLVRSRGDAPTNAEDSYDLYAYEIGGKRNETVAPTATIAGLPTQATHWKFDTVTIQFSELMQKETLDKQSLVVTDNTGRVIEGSFKASQDAVTFTPHMGAFSVDGLYKISLNSRAKDWAGNGATPTEWTFRADGAPPALIQSSPRQNAEGVSLSNPIALVMNEDFVVGGNSLTIGILDDQNRMRSYSTNAQVVGRVIYVRPEIPLEPGTRYHVVVPDDSIFDLAGNEMPSGKILTFTTAP